MNKELKRILLIAAAVIFIILGLIGLALPFLQGFLFLFIGVALLSLVSKRMREWLEVHTRRYPRAHKFVERIHAWMMKNIGDAGE
ncbi:hypothetical protein A2763_02355 [Candidatus Kaiserbacteria bacterium RIFCSPHIGHO2_01_FULL_54_36]|uniref:Uncharacterized protein n=1 Tax=Candidatus Kaiserbacteria bacterium RIFCSPHIGHO2_01_FULL_54_36 TaxID=1798482 RepID=A0A1F6CNH3_9BACT|nr:MAG: hypothetical protein A2763_02355 [Candidatus Kaiserbacteria bacterium RIFCSPHIGHO2_01_FULL_54_36]OGG76001.1 MAG: hypothetical protein A3A41_03460 [Candidatus Kaiserbacteria bacterium RIFCSPLOWO2_01_FULL_54_22]